MALSSGCTRADIMLATEPPAGDLDKQITEGGTVTAKAEQMVNEAEEALLELYRRQVGVLPLSDLRDPLLSKTYHKLRLLRDQLDGCLGNIDEIRMALCKLPFGTRAEEDEED